MGESIELCSFNLSNTNDQDNEIEEYHEIAVESAKEISVSPKTVKEYDFFTQIDVKTVQKLGQKKKKPKKIDRHSNLMEIVNAELASAASPITESMIVSKRDEREIEQNSILLRVPSVLSLFRKSWPLRLDYEHGWRQKQNIKITPIFPSILENVISNDHNIPVQYIEPVFFDDFAGKISDKSEGKGKFLDITVNNVKFLHHHLFSLEQMLCEKLVEKVNLYNSSHIMLNDLSRDIRINRETRNNVRQELLKICPNKKDDIRFDSTVRKYTGKLLKLKEQYIELLRNNKKNAHNIISLWSDIEMIREKYGQINTPYILDIVNKELDEEKFDETWTEAYNTEYNDLLDMIEYKYVTEYLEYKESKNAQSSELNKLSKPKIKFDEESVKEKVIEIVNSLVNHDQLDMVLKADESIISEMVQDGKDFLKSKYNLEIYVDSVFVCKSETHTCKNKTLFDVDFAESFSVQILPKNKMFTIALFENEDEVSHLNIDLTNISDMDNADFKAHKFVYKNILIEPTKRYVGTGFNIKEIAKENKVRLKSSNMFEGNLDTVCEISMKIGWNAKLGHSQNIIIKDSMEIGNKVNRLMHGIDKPNIEALTDLISTIYDKDVSKNENILQTLQNICKTKIYTNLEFPFDENTPEYNRLKLLRLRSNGGFTSIENKLVPLHASQICTEQLNCLQKSNEQDIGIEYINDKYSELDPIELQRFVGCKYVQKLNRNMLKNLNDHLMKKTHKDVVRDYKDLSWRSIFSNQTNLITLAALPKSTKQQYLNDALSKEQEIQVSVVRAFNLMDRTSTILTDDNDEDDVTIAGFKVRPLRPFVKLSYAGVSSQTATAIGCHPTWNQTIKMKTKLQPLSSLHINIFDEHKANLYEGYSDDEASQGKTVHYRYCNKWLGTLQVPLYSVLTSGTLRGTFKIRTPPIIFGYDVLQNKDATYSLIPEVTQLLKKEASFITLHITTSLSHLGGLQAYNQPIPSSPDDDDLIKHLNRVVTDYINEFPTRNVDLTFIDSSGRNKCVTQFLQPIPLPNYEMFPKNPKSRVESALSKSSGVSKSSSSKSSVGRRRETDIEANQEESVYSAFDGSWKGESQMVKMMNACLRYVSLIPTYEVSESYVVTLMGLELLKVLYGSPLDHTILLASYFLYLGIRCWVVIGRAFPRGLSSYVLTKYDLTTRRDVLVTDQLFKRKGFMNKNDGYLWNVYDSTSGERFELRDVSCPLKTVDYVFDSENIWLNMQTSQDCENVSFDLSRSSNWLPVFDNTIFVMSLPLVTDHSLYSLPPNVVRLREDLETKIKLKVQKWRPKMKTIWNRYCSSLLKEILPHLEYWTFNPTEPKPPMSHRLKQLMITYKLFGFPLNIPYLNAKSVISTVKSTGVHVSDDPNVEYGLAVEVYAYPNNVLSIWVFLASVTRI